MGLIDKQRFESRSGHGCSNSAYRVLRTTCCGEHCVEDTELQDIYFCPEDLSRRIPVWESDVACPHCAAIDWDLIEVDELAEVPEAWRWAC